MLTSDILKIVFMSSGVTISLLGLMMTIRNRFIDKRKQLRVNYEIQTMFSFPEFGDPKFSHMDLQIIVLNSGGATQFINQPYLKLPRKVLGSKSHHFADLEKISSFPFRLEPGQVYQNQFPLRTTLWGHLIDGLNKHDKVKFEVTNSFGKVYKSKRVRFSKLLQHLETEDLLRIRKN